MVCIRAHALSTVIYLVPHNTTIGCRFTSSCLSSVIREDNVAHEREVGVGSAYCTCDHPEGRQLLKLSGGLERLVQIEVYGDWLLRTIRRRPLDRRVEAESKMAPHTSSICKGT